MDYRKRMTEYYPQVLRDCRDMQAIIYAEAPEFDLIATNSFSIEDETCYETMSRERIEQWEKLLGLNSNANLTLEERRSVIIGKLHDTGKINESVIQEIVHTMTNGTAECSFDEGILYVEITPAVNDGMDLYPEVDKELSIRIPAHIRLDVSRKLATWQQILNIEDTWNDVKNNYSSWRYVKTIVPKG